MIYHLIYISEKTPLFQETIDLLRILEKSRENNQKKQVTGLLIKKGEFFIQVLEGKREDVMTTFNRISPDPRHKKLKTLLTYQDSTRIFPSWDMGSIDVEKNEVNITKLLALLQVDMLKQKDSKDKIITLLKNFNSF